MSPRAPVAVRLSLLPGLLLLLTGARTATDPAGTIGGLSEAVATVNDWRAILLFLIFVLISDRVWNAIERGRDRRASDRLVAAMDRLTEQVATAAKQELLHQARVEAYINRGAGDAR